MQGVGGGGGQREGGPTSYRRGFLTRRLPPIVLWYLSSTTGSILQKVVRVQVTGLQNNLSYLLGVSATAGDAAANIEPEIDPAAAGLLGQYPLNPGTMQITPFVDPPQGTRQIYRPVFQDPTATDNKNHPLPADIPFAWIVDGDEADGCYVDVDIGAGAWSSEAVNGQVVFQLTIAYDAAWWDTTALEKAIAMVNIKGVSAQPDTIGTGGG